jgi:LDH2 family malate/lactate/ureidoglycolate dehydrogenase
MARSPPARKSRVLRRTAEELRAATAAIFRAAGAGSDEAETVADGLVDAELAGHESHGLIRVSEYLRHIREGLVIPDAQPEIVHDGGATLVVDGHWGFGHVVMRRTTEWLIARTRRHGVAAATVRHCAHVGRAGVYPEMAAQQGLVAFAFVNGGGAEPRVAPFGGRGAVFGTNPIAAAVPLPGSPPVVIDFSTATVASGKIRVLRDRGESLPEGWILDAHGEPSTDPADYYAGGTLRPMADHKGYALCLLVELLAGCLAGAGSVAVPDSGYRLGNGVFLQAIDVAAFMDAGRFAALAGSLAAVVRATPPAAGHERVLLPGDPERDAAQRRRIDGCDIAASTWGQMTAAAAELGVTL